MSAAQDLHTQWVDLRDRLLTKSLLEGDSAALSLRIPGGDAMWFGRVQDRSPQRLTIASAARDGQVHAAIYNARGDVGAIAEGGGKFGRCLADFGGVMPQVFDEQARHLGSMASPIKSADEAPAALKQGGNVMMMQDWPVCLGTTALRLALNAELFEKCAKAYVLAVAGNGRVRPLPWLVRWVANGRLTKDQKRAAARFSQGLSPLESAGY